MIDISYTISNINHVIQERTDPHVNDSAVDMRIVFKILELADTLFDRADTENAVLEVKDLLFDELSCRAQAARAIKP